MKKSLGNPALDHKLGLCCIEKQKLLKPLLYFFSWICNKSRINLKQTLNEYMSICLLYLFFFLLHQIHGFNFVIYMKIY